MKMRELMTLVEKAQAARTVDDLKDFDGESIKDGCTKCIPDEIEHYDFAFVWWVGGSQSEMQAKHRAFIAMEKEMTEETVRHSSMVTGQLCVNPDKIASLMDNPTDKRPVIQRWNGFNILFDGNHRVTADILSGKKSSKCLVMHCDKYFDKQGQLKS